MKGFAAALRAITKAAPGLRDAGVAALKLDGVEIVLIRAAPAPGKPAPAASPAEEDPQHAKARAILADAGGLSPSQTDDLMADLRRFD